jgi:hypothetical protein
VTGVVDAEGEEGGGHEVDGHEDQVRGCHRYSLR